MIELAGVGRRYEVGEGYVDALKDVSEVIHPGEHVAIMGPSGCGKSTLLHVIGTLDRPTSGAYHLDGCDLSVVSDEELTLIRRDVMGFVFQAFHLVPRLTGLANVELPMMLAGIPRLERRGRSRRALDSVEMLAKAHHRPREMSGGEQQRIAIARALSMEPRVVLADEPTGNLDRANGDQVMKTLLRVPEEGRTLLVVTHDPRVARLAHRVLVLEDGRVVRRLRGNDLATVAEALAEAPVMS